MSLAVFMYKYSLYECLYNCINLIEYLYSITFLK